jgi:hypothetical protein
VAWVLELVHLLAEQPVVPVVRSLLLTLAAHRQTAIKPLQQQPVVMVARH